MAFHYYPHLENRSPISYIEEFEPKLINYAKEAEKVLSLFPELTVWKIQRKGKGAPNVCWYVGFKDKEEPFLLNFTISTSDLNIEYRFSQYLPKDIFEVLKWQTTSWRRANLKTYGFEKSISYIKSYLELIKEDFQKGILKQGGKSFAEKMILNLLKDIYPNIFIQSNVRLDNMRSLKGKPLELDLYIQDQKLAFEIQGPQHFENIYGDNSSLMENDQYKKKLCQDLGIKLIWLNWEGINSDLLKFEYEKRLDEIKKIINLFENKKLSFIWWKNSNDIFY